MLGRCSVYLFQHPLLQTVDPLDTDMFFESVLLPRQEVFGVPSHVLHI